MPELPDVEVFKRYLDATSLNKAITHVHVRDTSILSEITSQKLREQLVGRRFRSSRRHGKYLFAELEGAVFLALHFGMTGFLKYFKRPERAPGHIRLLIRFANGFHLGYDCQRRLGQVGLVDQVENFVKEKDLGPDALEFDFSSFKKALAGRKGSVKTALMNQKLIAGIGNVYSDEILFQAEVHPKAPIGQLDDKTVKALFSQMKKVLLTAIDRKADPERIPGSFLLPHRRSGATCPVCDHELDRLRISGRSAYLCPTCQYKG